MRKPPVARALWRETGRGSGRRHRNRPILWIGLGIVFHLAAAVGVRLIIESPVRTTLETNVYGTQLVLDLALKKKEDGIYGVTSEVYGKSNQMPFREDADLVLGLLLASWPSPESSWWWPLLLAS